VGRKISQRFEDATLVEEEHERHKKEDVDLVK
jgi:hypothetical protein